MIKSHEKYSVSCKNAEVELTRLQCPIDIEGRSSVDQLSVFRKSRTTLMSGLTGSPSSGRINGVGSSKRTYEMRSISSRKGSNICA
ncbi:hypothetical protein TNCV_2171871 [Trichonephila clavipes]|nr:hypothetical protein TNCV_2171871 [Trichonephila clavipes]